MKAYIAEFIGTAALVLIGCGTVTLGGLGGILGGGQALSPLAIFPIASAFGLTVTAMAYAIGPVSGCHINPAVTVGLWSAGRFPTSQVLPYIGAQVLGAIAGAVLLYVILNGGPAPHNLAIKGLGANGWGAGYLGAYGLGAAIIVEFIATFLFLVVILGVTSPAGHHALAGLAIGLTLLVLHLPFVNVTGLSVNPARSLAPALFVGGTAFSQVWLFIVVPIVAGYAAGWLFKSKTLEA